MFMGPRDPFERKKILLAKYKKKLEFDTEDKGLLTLCFMVGGLEIIITLIFV